MQITSLNLNLYNNNLNINNKKDIGNICPIKTLKNDTVSFSGAAKVLSDTCDKAFVNILSKEFELSKESANTLKNTVWDFLRKNKMQSLGEIGGDEHFDEQVDLQRLITKNLSIDENDDMANQYIADELIKRCDEGEDYIPLGLNGYKRNESNFDSLKDRSTFSQGMRKMLEDSNDDDFYSFAKKMLRQDAEESFEFRNTVNEFLEENKLTSIKELFSDDELLNEQAALIEKLEKKFDLSETETIALNFEFLERANTPALKNYSNVGFPFVKDIDGLNKIVEDGGYNHQVESWDFDTSLYRQMANEAEKKGYKNIFEIFKEENEPASSETYKYITDSALTKDQQMDLIIDLVKVARNPEAFTQSLPKHEQRDNFYASIQTDMITEKIAETFGLNSILSEQEYLASKSLRDSVKKLYPSHVQGGQNSPLKQISLEIADNYDLPAGAHKTIEKIITNIQNGGERAADEYEFTRIKREFGIE